MVRTTTMPTKPPSSLAAPGASSFSTGTLSIVMNWEMWIHGYAKNWHDAFEILGAVGSAAAAVVAVWLASRERVDRKAAEKDRDIARSAQLKAEQAEAKRDREAQARKVSVRADYETRAATLFESSSYYMIEEYIEVKNYSELPITNVTVGYRHPDGSKHVSKTATFLGPGAAVTGTLPPRDPETESRIDVDGAYVLFRDLAGLVWERYMDGRLVAGRIDE
ncbi:hypothetical protein ACFWGN_20830 [Oerskovia sp. NPDC060338]|uniref:hypothetical protein n=1 Tax=Oerskovia sp. NPDC060338 TaxID=3347100 RepID=UPI0036686516